MCVLPVCLLSFFLFSGEGDAGNDRHNSKSWELSHGWGAADQKQEGCACGMPVTFDPEEVVPPVIRHPTEGVRERVILTTTWGGSPHAPGTLPLGTESTVRKTTSKGRDQVQSWNWFLYGKTENIIKIKIKPVLKKPAPGVSTSCLWPSSGMRPQPQGSKRMRAFCPTFPILSPS